jgi:hypothetical protein
MFGPQNNFLATILTISYLLNHSKQNSIATTSKENENKLEGKKNANSKQVKFLTFLRILTHCKPLFVIALGQKKLITFNR